MVTSEFVTRLRADISARIDELTPRLAEHAILRAALDSLDAQIAPRPRYGARQRQVLAALNSCPGSTPRAIAAALGVSPTLVYAPLRTLKLRGSACQRDGRWYPATAEGTQAG